MDFKKLLETDDDERAVSPVIGVILMVAITVILAAVIGAFVIGIGDDQQEVPTASFNFDQSGSSPVEVDVTHQSGDTLQQGNIDVTVDGDQAESGSGNPVWASTGEITAGSSVTVDHKDGSQLAGGETIRIVWTSDSGGDSSVLTDYDVQTP
ncbi:type IV pilin [Natronoarchaeum sp. GCM10025703]|uniref:type IV pilin n=1 Tax=unclassified Natronoarchaeum TaxID=2620183 RepID=UPI00360CCD7C